MITNMDRSKWIGASDMRVVFGDWNTDTFAMWWLVKLGVLQNDYKNKYMEFGNLAEHAIIETISAKIKKGKKPVYKRKYRLRVNYDGLLSDRIVEIKTVTRMPNKPPLDHIRQCQALMYVLKKKKTDIWYYETQPDEYDRPYYLDVDERRLKRYEIIYDQCLVQEIQRRCAKLAKALKRRVYPNET